MFIQDLYDVDVNEMVRMSEMSKIYKKNNSRSGIRRDNIFKRE